MNAEMADVKVIRVKHERMVYEKLDMISREWSGYLATGYRNFVIDFECVRSMDSSSIGCLMDFYRKVKNAGGQIRLANLHTRIQTLLAMVGAKSLFDIYSSVDEAKAAFGG